MLRQVCLFVLFISIGHCFLNETNSNDTATINANANIVNVTIVNAAIDANFTSTNVNVDQNVNLNRSNFNSLRGRIRSGFNKRFVSFPNLFQF